jgi:hypothetical protein
MTCFCWLFGFVVALVGTISGLAVVINMKQESIINRRPAVSVLEADPKYDTYCALLLASYY